MATNITFNLYSSHIGVITIDRPQVRNALDRAAMVELGQAIQAASEQSGLRAVILSGVGQQAFISGGDLNDLYQLSTEQDGLRQHDLMTTTLSHLDNLPYPVFAAMEGAARGGGCEVALACDLRIAASDATLGFTQVDMAVTPGWGGAKRLYHLVGYAHALDLLMTGRILTADEGHQLGLVDRITEPGKALESALELAGQIAEKPPLAVQGIKAVLRGYHSLPMAQARSRERSIFGKLWASADHAEAANAFIEKRPPAFKGK